MRMLDQSERTVWNYVVRDGEHNALVAISVPYIGPSTMAEDILRHPEIESAWLLADPAKRDYIART